MSYADSFAWHCVAGLPANVINETDAGRSAQTPLRFGMHYDATLPLGYRLVTFFMLIKLIFRNTAGIIGRGRAVKTHFASAQYTTK